MAKIAETFNVGNYADLTPEKILDLLEIAYRDLAIAINKKPDIYERKVDGDAGDVFLSNGDVNINTDTGKVEILTEHTNPTTVVWTQIS